MALKLHVILKTSLFFVWILPIFWMLMLASLQMLRHPSVWQVCNVCMWVSQPPGGSKWKGGKLRKCSYAHLRLRAWLWHSGQTRFLWQSNWNCWYVLSVIQLIEWPVTICDVIMENQSEYGNIDFKIEPNIAENCRKFLVFPVVFGILQMLISLEPIDQYQWGFLQNIAVKMVHTVS